MKKNKRIVIFLFMMCTFLTGCWDQRELHHVLYINSLGIDFKDNNYIIRPQFINFSNIAKQEGSTTRNYSQAYIGKGKGPILDEAAFDFYKGAQQEISWEHLKTIVVTERFLKHGDLNQFNDFFSRFFQFRDTMWIFGTKEPLENILANNNILNISQLYTIINLPKEITKQYTIIDPLPLYKFQRNYYEPGMTTRIPFLATTKTYWKKGHTSFPMLKFSGYGFINDKSYINHLNSHDIAGVRWTDENTKRAPLLLKFNKKIIGHIVLKNPKIDTKHFIKNGKLRMLMNIHFDADIFQLINYMPVNDIKKIAEDQVEKEIKKTYRKGIERGIDTYQLSHSLYRQNSKLWKQYKKEGGISLQNKELDLNVSINIATNGKSKNMRNMIEH
ncbi:spore germination protein [Bacillus cereus]|uniref:Ger(x)C family spore germination protein n=1 Tax=Bacillus nitratireducens TaxID=2026193 RepID=UPI000BEC3CD0|nr:Ger(x)C family spore germination protein [Bacillus nitratireducens]PDY13196.1 spore germination protein [Bacillus cereus]PES62313.1 spore germination protein [Bacillus cereus]PEW86296.1 spore germination protein [Bacillus cereus]PFJ54903.1 spore germination protein [Bacillus cereus]PFJ75855.1 spore germination protein [Bacillus cereus]